MATLSQAVEALECPVGSSTGPGYDDNHYAHYGAPCCDNCWAIIKAYIEKQHKARG